MPNDFPINATRAQFPALARTEGTRVAAYLDGPGGTQRDRSG
ncbi:MAG: hypothetical protein U9N56_06210 [Actinomycetota bacterium]|nr:hypothetical protein [Actinomycetota bacterium]